MWCSAADTHLKKLYCAVSGARVLTAGVFECDIAHRRSVAVLCMLYKIRCNTMHPRNSALPGPYVPVRVTRGALVEHRYFHVSPRCRTLYYRRTFIPSKCPSGTILLPPYSTVWDRRVSGAGPLFFVSLSCSVPTTTTALSTLFPFLCFSVYCGAGVFGQILFSLSLVLPTIFNNNNKNK